MKILSRLFPSLGGLVAAPEPAPPAPQVGASPSAVSIPDLASTMNGKPIPRYPEPGHAVPATPVAELIHSQRALIAQLGQTLGISREERARLLDPVLERYASYVHLLPASETHHHCGIGGLFRHGVEVAFYAARYTEGIVFGMDLPPQARQPFAIRARLIAAFAGLLHDIGKPMVDIGAMDPNTGALWNPHTEPLSEWLTTNQLAYYTLFWRPGARHRRHEAFAPAMVHQIIGRETLGYLGEREASGLLDILFLALSNDGNVRHPIIEAVKIGDSASVAMDLERQSEQTTQAAGGSVRALAVRIIHAMQLAIREGDWVPNTPGSPLWCTEKGIYLTYPDALSWVIDRVQRDGRLPIPSQPLVLAQALLDARYAIPCKTAATGTDGEMWEVTIDVTDGKQTRALTLRGLRIDRADSLFGDEPLPGLLAAKLAGEPEPPPEPEPEPEPESVIDAAPAESTTTESAPPTPTAPETTQEPATVSTDDEPVIRNRRTETDLAERKLRARAQSGEGPSTPEAAKEWLQSKTPGGDFLLEMASRAGIARCVDYHGDRLLVAYPKPFEGLGVAVGRLAQILMQNRWVEPDVATQGKATITAPIHGVQQLAVSFTPALSRILTLVLNEDPGVEPEAPANNGVACPSDDIKRAFYRFLASRHRTEGSHLHTLAPAMMEDDCKAFAIEKGIAADQLLEHLRAPPHPMLAKDTFEGLKSFTDYLTAQAEAKRVPA